MLMHADTADSMNPDRYRAACREATERERREAKYRAAYPRAIAQLAPRYGGPARPLAYITCLAEEIREWHASRPTR